jgi:hypothetical protein
MQVQTITPRNITADYAFSGDSTKTYFCEIVDSNLNTDGNPIVNSVRPGWINLTCLPRHLNAQLRVIFHTADEKPAAETFEMGAAVKSTIPKWALPSFAGLLKVSKKLAAATLILFCLSTGFAVVNYYFDITGFLELYSKFNAANGAKVVAEKTSEIVDYFNDPFYESEGVRYIEKREGVVFKDLFSKVSSDLYMMRDVFVDSEGEPILMTYGDAEDKCDNLGGFVPSIATQDSILPSKKYIRINQWADHPEWTSNPLGTFSDDYQLNPKMDIEDLNVKDVPAEAYLEDGKMYGDDGDVLSVARCAVLRISFIDPDEEKEDDE